MHPTPSISSTKTSLLDLSFDSNQPEQRLSQDKDEDTICEKVEDDAETKDVDKLEREEGSDVVSFPEGGREAWLVVLGVWISQFCTFGYTNAYGVYNDYYVRTYMVNRYTSSQVSWVGSVQLFLVLSVGLLSGRAFDAGYFYHLMIGGSSLFVFCVFMLSVTQPEQLYQVFLVQGLGIGMSVGLVYIPSVAVLSQYFRKRRPLAIGLATSGSAAGGALHPIMLNAWFHGSLGFHNGVRASAGLNAGLLLIAIFLMKPRKLLNQHKSISTVQSFRRFLCDIPYVIMIAGTVLVLAGLYYPIFFLQLNSIKNGIDPHLAFYTIAILNGASAVGRIIPNLFVYRYGAFNVVIPCVMIAGILVFCTLVVKDVVGTMIFAILYGFFSGAYASVLPPMVGSMAENDSEIGARLGICFTFTGFGGLIGTPIAGALLSTEFLWWRPILFSGLCVLSGCACFACTRCLKAKKKGTQWL